MEKQSQILENIFPFWNGLFMLVAVSIVSQKRGERRREDWSRTGVWRKNQLMWVTSALIHVVEYKHFYKQMCIMKHSSLTLIRMFFFWGTVLKLSVAKRSKMSICPTWTTSCFRGRSQPQSFHRPLSREVGQSRQLLLSQLNDLPL